MPAVWNNLRNLRDLYTFDPGGQVWARSMADLLIHANAAAPLPAPQAASASKRPNWRKIRAWYRGAVAKGISGNQGKRARWPGTGCGLARRFRDHQDMILRFATDLAVGFTSNQARRDVRPVKVQQRSSGGTWRTLEGLADLAVAGSCVPTTAKWGISELDALRQLYGRALASARNRSAVTGLTRAWMVLGYRRSRGRFIRGVELPCP